MRKIIITLCLISLFSFTGCGEKMKEMKDAAEAAKNISSAADQITNNMKAAEEKKAERIKKGDTLAMNFEKLQAYIPASISGYKAGKPDGSTVNMQGFSVSNSKIRFTSEAKTDDNIEIELTDYNQAGQMFAAMTPWMSGFSLETADKSEKTYNPGIKNVIGFESVDKANKRVTLTLAVGWRFLLRIESNHSTNADNLKNIVKSMKLTELSAL